jgi:bacterioferritin-associated ferredoxin
VFAVGEGVEHRGQTYGLVAPVWDRAKVCADAITGVAESAYTGSITGTRLKVTGIAIYSAGDFAGGDGTEEVTFRDPARGVYRRLLLQNDVLIGAVLYGDARDGGWYFGLIRDREKLGAIRDTIIFGQDVAMAASGADPAAGLAAMADTHEVCGCNGVCKGAILGAINQKGLATLDAVRAHTKASASCGSYTGTVEGLLALAMGPGYVAPRGEKPICKCTTLGHDTVRAEIADRALKMIPAVMQQLGWTTPDGCHVCRPGAQLLSVVRLARRVRGPGAEPLRQRADARQHPEGRHLLRRAAHVGRPHQCPRAARHRRRGGQIRDPDRQGHGRSADRPARRQARRSAGGLAGFERGRHGVRPCLRQGAAHSEDLRRLGVVPVRRAGQHQHGRGAGEDDVGKLAPAQGQARRLRLPAQLRRGEHQGLRRGCGGERLGAVGRR